MPARGAQGRICTETATDVALDRHRQASRRTEERTWACSTASAASPHPPLRTWDDDSPARQLRLGFDYAGRLLELVVLRVDSGNELLIHAMKARRQYLDLPD